MYFRQDYRKSSGTYKINNNLELSERKCVLHTFNGNYAPGLRWRPFQSLDLTWLRSAEGGGRRAAAGSVSLPVTRYPIGTLRPVTRYTSICALDVSIITITRVAEVLKMERVLPVRG